MPAQKHPSIAHGTALHNRLLAALPGTTVRAHRAAGTEWSL
jgi:hypothetical protein